MADTNDTEETLRIEGQADPPAPDAETPDPAPEQAAAPEEEDEPEGAAEIEGKGTMVPLAALKSEREKRQQYEKDAKRAKEMEEYLSQARPYIEFLRNNPQLLQPQQPPPQAPTPQETAKAEQQFVDYARKFDLYTPDGKPDVVRAQAIIEDNRKLAREEAQRAIAPLQQQSMTQRAEANVQAMRQVKDAHGRPVQDKYLAQTVQAITQGTTREQVVEMLSDPRVTNMLAQQAAVMQFQQEPKTDAPSTDPLFRESAGGGGRYVMSNEEKSLARASGIQEKDWIRTAKKFEPGKPMALED